MSLVVLADRHDSRALVLRSRLSVERPGGFQQAAELLLTNPMGFGIKDLLEENVGHGARKVHSVSRHHFRLHSALQPAQHFPGIFLAHGRTLRASGLRHARLSLFQLAGHPPSWGRPLSADLRRFPQNTWRLGPCNSIVPCRNYFHFGARVLSLTVRLWANIFASDLIYVIFLGLLLGPFEWAWTKNPVLGIIAAIFPVFIPLVFVALHIFVSVIQAYIFTVLPAIYVGLAVADEH